MVRERDLWLVSDEAYEHVLFDGVEHVSPASLPGMYERTIPVYTFSKSYAATGLRLGYLAVKDERVRERLKKALFYTTSNVSSIVQFGAIGALEGSQACIAAFRDELQARRDFFYAGLARAQRRRAGRRATEGRVLRLRANRLRAGVRPSRMRRRPFRGRWPQHLITRGRIGCVPGLDFGSVGEGYVRFCFAPGIGARARRGAGVARGHALGTSVNGRAEGDRGLRRGRDRPRRPEAGPSRSADPGDCPAATHVARDGV